MPPVSPSLSRHVAEHYAARRFDDIARLLHDVDIEGLDAQTLMFAANAAIQSGQLAAADRWLSALRAQAGAPPGLGRIHAQVLNRLGLAVMARGEDASARGCFERALAADPQQTAARLNLALEFRKAGLPERALALLQSLVRDDPENADLRAHLVDASLEAGLACIEMDEHDQAIGIADACIAAAGLRAPALRVQLALRLGLSTVLADAAAITLSRARWQEGIEALRAIDLGAAEPRLSQLAWSNFGLAYHGQNDLSLQSRYGDWLADAAARMRPDLATLAPPPARARRRVVLPSSHWCDCTAGHYFANWIGMLAADPALDVHALAIGPRLDTFTDALAAQGASVHRLANPDADVIADAIAALQPDLVLYPELGMDVRLLPVAALRLAPVQAMAWGHPVTSGLPNIDAYLSCAGMEPEDAAQHYREALHLLPGIGTRYVPPTRPQPASRDELGLPQGPLVVVPQSALKIHPDNDAIYRELLLAAPALHLLLFDNESAATTQRLRERIARDLPAHASERIHFHPLCARERFLQVLRACDLMLDPLHWSGGNTALDALRMDLPILTAPGAFMRGRQSAAMLQILGLSAALLATPATLAARASDLLADDTLPRLRARIAAGFDALVAGEEVAATLRQIVHDLLAGRGKVLT